jgi:hypothetical protein
MRRADLEKPASIRKAHEFEQQFCDRNGEFSDEDIYRKAGVAKVLAEEYLPLLNLAKTLKLVRSIRLFPQSNQGPDGEIRFWWRFPSKVQITCSAENYEAALKREQLSNMEPVFSRQTRCRESGRITATGRAFMAPEEDLKQRLTRILAAIDQKNANYYSGTDTLLVLDELANFQHLRELHEHVRRFLGRPQVSNYKKIFVVYGVEVKRAR